MNDCIVRDELRGRTSKTKASQYSMITDRIRIIQSQAHLVLLGGVEPLNMHQEGAYDEPAFFKSILESYIPLVGKAVQPSHSPNRR